MKAVKEEEGKHYYSSLIEYLKEKEAAILSQADTIPVVERPGEIKFVGGDNDDVDEAGAIASSIIHQRLNGIEKKMDDEFAVMNKNYQELAAKVDGFGKQFNELFSMVKSIKEAIQGKYTSVPQEDLNNVVEEEDNMDREQGARLDDVVLNIVQSCVSLGDKVFSNHYVCLYLYFILLFDFRCD